MDLRKVLISFSLFAVLIIAACSSGSYKDCNKETDVDKCMEDALKTCTTAKATTGKEGEPTMLAKIEGKEGDKCKVYMEVTDVPSTMKGAENVPPEIAKEMIGIMQTLKGKYMVCKIPSDMMKEGMKDINSMMMSGELCEGNLIEAFGEIMGKMFAVAMKAGMAGGQGGVQPADGSGSLG